MTFSANRASSTVKLPVPHPNVGKDKIARQQLFDGERSGLDHSK